MLQHIFKIIWSERRSNLWIILELTLVFCILWFCCDYLYFMAKRYLQPMNVDIENVYIINIKKKADSGYQRDSLLPPETEALTILDRIKLHPAIEAAAYSINSYPYSGSMQSRQYRYIYHQDTVLLSFTVKAIMPDYFHVFKIQKLEGDVFDWNRGLVEGQVVMSDGDQGGNIEFLHTTQQVSDIAKGSDDENKAVDKELVSARNIKKLIGDDGNYYTVTGYVQKSKYDDFQTYEPTIYFPMEKSRMGDVNWLDLTVRIKPEAAKNFEENFVKDMKEQLMVGPYFLASVTPVTKMKEDFMRWSSRGDTFKSIFAVSAFLIVNIFLGIIGTFWFRTQARRSEIGLRIALGATRNSVKGFLQKETLILLFIASILAAIICINVTMVDVLKDIGVPSIYDRANVVGKEQYFINYIITFVFLALISIIAVWYPASQASKTQPAEALKDE